MSDLKSAKIAVLCGGFSEERDVSLRSGENVYQALKKMGYSAKKVDPASQSNWLSGYDIAFNLLHGQFGEDGGVQAMLSANNLAYTGSGIQASVIGMNKLLTKQVLVQKGIPTPDYQVIQSGIDYQGPDTFPVILKPIQSGSSVDLYIADTPEERQRYSEALVKKYGHALLESYIEGKEVTVSILGPQAQALPILELRPKNRLYDYEAKYTKGATEFILPATISEKEAQLCQQYARSLYQAIGACGAARVDMIVSPQKGPQVLEINTLPGMTDTSDLPAQAAKAGISFHALIEGQLKDAIQGPKK